MIVLSWNCRGLGQPATVPALCELVKARKADVVFLYETISSSSRLELIRVKLKFTGCFTVDCVGRSGGLCLMWNNKVDCSLLSFSSNHIDVEILCNNVKTRLTGFYGFPERQRRALSWNLLKQLSAASQLPWVCLGDFNDLLSHADKRGRVDHPEYLFRGFRDAVDESGLVDIPIQGHQFTWSRCRGTQNFVEERLDRALGNQDWLDMFPNVKLVNLIAPVSDHNPIMLDTNPLWNPRRPRLFKFENKWLEEGNLPYVVKKSWSGFKDLGVFGRLHATAEVLTEWGDQKAKAFITTKREYEHELKSLQGRNDMVSCLRASEIRKLLSKALINEETHWRQRAKISWLKGGDSTTNFFHNIVKARNRANKIDKLKNTEGEWEDTQQGIRRVVGSYFEDLFSVNTSARNLNDVLEGVRPMVSNVDNDHLIEPFTLEEFKVAIKQMHPDKSPGPDGFNPAFYQKFWGLVGEDIFEACSRWLRNGEFPDGLNDTHVVLIPKCDAPSSMKDLRPISLCNVVYKIMSKVLCNRLKLVLPELVNKSQSAFVVGRSIQDNILTAYELLHSMKKKTRGTVGELALKIDISKAYDRVDWEYLEGILRRLGFCDTWVNWMLLCVRSVRYSFKVNDELVGPVIPGRGLRQGDPLSPYLFILCAEGLSALLSRVNRLGTLHRGKVCRRSPSISHLFFADDCLLFCKANQQEATSLKQTLVTYEMASGQAINFDKSGSFFSTNVEEGLRTVIGDILGVHRGLDTGCYLCLPSLIGRQKRQVFSYIREKMWKTLSSWRNKKISKAGKEVLIKAAAQSIPTYCMSVFLLPKTLLDEQHRMLNKFWWENNNKGVKWSRWEDLCEDKDRRGMGFKDLHLFNLALLGKMGWRLLMDPDSLVCRLLKSKYFPNGDFLNSSLGSSPSYTWRSIWTAMPIVRQGVRWKIGDGTSINVWNHPWIRDDNKFKIYTPIIPGLEDLKVSDLLVPGSSCWDVELIHELFSQDDVHRILATPISPAGFSDSILWHFSKDGRYTTKSAYTMGFNIVRGEEEVEVERWSLIWDRKVPPKVKSCVWRICKRFTPTKTELFVRKAVQDKICVMCDSELETDWHVFMGCTYARACWRNSEFHDAIEAEILELDSLHQLILSLLQKLPNEKGELFLVVLWRLWKERNEKVFNGALLAANMVVPMARFFLEEWREVHSLKTEKPAASGCNAWHHRKWAM